MAKRRETRIVPVEREIDVVDCDNCGQTAEVLDPFRDKPAEWLLVAHDDQIDGIFCSNECLRQWASGSTELTEIARKAFDEATGGTAR